MHKIDLDRLLDVLRQAEQLFPADNEQMFQQDLRLKMAVLRLKLQVIKRMQRLILPGKR